MTGLIAHEWIEACGGAEEVLSQMMSALPDSDVVCLWNDAPERFDGLSVRETWLGRTPLRKNKAAALALMPATWRTWDTGDAEWVLASSHAFAHHVGDRELRDAGRHFSYIHTPARYLWEPALDPRGRGPLASVVRGHLRRTDRVRAQLGSNYAANSDYVRRRLLRFWNVDAEVIAPPVRVDLLRSRVDWRDALTDEDARTMESLPREYVLGAARFVTYKRLCDVIRAAELADLPAVIAGTGTDEPRLREIAVAASVPVTFVIAPSDALLFSMYQHASVYVFPAVEDFGIMPVEAMTLGTPVVVNREGGAKESVLLLEGGELADFSSDASLTHAMDRALRRERELVGMGAGRYSEKSFRTSLRTWMGVENERSNHSGRLGSRGLGSPDRDEPALPRPAAVA